ncbi:MAG: PEP-CTERM sorting domain-containing protein [Pirellulales bacterium]
MRLPRLSIPRTFLSILVGLASCASMLSSAQAGKIGFSLRFSADKGVIQAPDGDWSAAIASTIKSYQDALLAGKMPYVLLTNYAETASITELSMTIGDTTKNFDMVFPQVTAAPGIGYTVNSPDRVHGGVRSDLVDMGFTGFAPGKTFLFRVDIDPDDAAAGPYLDYRQTLFNAYNPSKNAIITVKFSDGYSVTGSLPDFAVYEEPPTPACSVGRSKNPVIEAYTYTKIVPEPSSLAILGVGTVGLLLLGWRRKTAVH